MWACTQIFETLTRICCLPVRFPITVSSTLHHFNARPPLLSRYKMLVDMLQETLRKRGHGDNTVRREIERILLLRVVSWIYQPARIVQACAMVRDEFNDFRIWHLGIPRPSVSFQPCFSWTFTSRLWTNFGAYSRRRSGGRCELGHSDFFSIFSSSSGLRGSEPLLQVSHLTFLYEIFSF